MGPVEQSVRSLVADPGVVNFYPSPAPLIMKHFLGSFSSFRLLIQEGPLSVTSGSI